MPEKSLYRPLGTLLVLFVLVGTGSCLLGDKTVDFNADVKPIINRECITCHGGVKAKAGFSLLFREEALAATESGKPAIIPGKPGQSEMIRRLKVTDPEERMPYKHPALAPEDISILERWIKQGAKWGEHWAYLPVKKPATPSTASDGNAWIRNDLDRFVYAKIMEAGLQPSPQAEKSTLLRRVSLDLTGLPAPASLAEKFLSNPDSNAAYEELVDSLLASPHYGERWASMWLDLARYADTKGYERDGARSIWKYRDWLIKAFNNDMPYDEFITDQLAGDLLPDPSDDQYIATAFHRNTMTNDEGGTDNEEFRTAAVIDRVNTTWEALLGTSFSCVQCHSHPYDPFRHKEYYSFMAYFDNSRDEDTYDDYPLLRQYDTARQLQLQQLVSWVRDQTSSSKSKELKTFLRTGQPAINSLTADSFFQSELSDTKWLVFRRNGRARLKAVDLSGKNQVIFRYRTPLDKGRWTLRLDSASGPTLFSKTLSKNNGWTVASILFSQRQGTHDLFLSYQNSGLENDADNGLFFDWFYFTEEIPGKTQEIISLLEAPVQTTPIMMENPAPMHRQSYVFERGNWLVKADSVQPAVPASLSFAMPDGAPANRLGLARWMTDKRNPLLSRTLVNRCWEQLFGTGLVETLEDLGSQGMLPYNAPLLEHLSWQLMNTDHWSMKKLLKEIVMSATYRQSSRLRSDDLQKDPFNHYYARGPRVRLSAEQIRDQLLAVTEDLNEEVAGPSVFPYQPEGIWLSPYNGATWKMDSNTNQYRRALYTYWKRTAPYPSMIMFDAVGREVCSARRIRTNTPTQALVLLNDSVYIDLSKRFASWMLSKSEEPDAAIAAGFRQMFFRPIDEERKTILLNLYRKALARYQEQREKTGTKLAEVEKAKLKSAAMFLVANAMINMDEFITKN